MPEGLMSKKPAVVPLLVALVVWPGCDFSFLVATGKFGTTAAADVKDLQALPTLADEYRHGRAKLVYLRMRLLNDASATDGLETFLKKAQYPVAQATGPPIDQAWADHCDQIAAADKVVDKLLSLVGAYAQALQALSSQDHTGSDLSKVVTDFTTDLGKIAPGLPSKVTGTVSAAAGPVSQLAGILAESYTQGKVREIVGNAHPAISVVLKGIAAYVQAVEEEALDAANLEMEGFKAAYGKRPATSNEIAAVWDIEAHWNSMMDSHARKTTQLLGELQDLTQAEQALFDARDPAKTDAQVKALLKTVAALQ